MSKKLGVIGGLGSKATAYFFNQLVDLTEAHNDQEHIELLIHNHPQIPDRTAYIIGASDDDPMPYLLEDAKTLIAAGCEFIYVPCNTAHYFINQFEEALKARFVHMIDETVTHVKKLGHQKVLLLATTGTIQTRLYQEAFTAQSVVCEVLPEHLQHDLMCLIYDKIKSGYDVNESEIQPFIDFAQQHDVDAIILGCTELSLLKTNLQLSEFYIDAMECAIRACIKRAGKEVKIR